MTYSLSSCHKQESLVHMKFTSVGYHLGHFPFFFLDVRVDFFLVVLDFFLVVFGFLGLTFLLLICVSFSVKPKISEWVTVLYPCPYFA